jgi:hypothetical protein
MAKQRVNSQTKRFVYERAQGCCEYCRSQARFALHSFAIEHIFPCSLGGNNAPDNLALSCQGCNSHKYTKTKGFDPVSSQTVPLFHPRQHEWSVHFAWNHDYTMIIGLTQIGRATIATLKLNREEVVNFRRVLVALGEHPPEAVQR